jgi:hypothetical protein
MMISTERTGGINDNLKWQGSIVVGVVIKHHFHAISGPAADDPIELLMSIRELGSCSCPCFMVPA